jgi:G3E family GTPase
MTPLTLVTGFLGAGKTSLLRHLLTWRATQARRPTLAVIINEFATLGLDAVQLPAGDHHVWELNRGSIFCVCLRTDFIALLERIIREICPDEIWVEATGVADVGEVFKMLSVPTLRTAVYLRTHVCVVDPGTIMKVVHTLRAAREQVRLADVIILNKIDTATPALLAAVTAQVRTLNAHAPLVHAVRSEVDVAGLPTFSVPRLDTRPFGGHPPQPIASISLAEPWQITAAAFQHWWQQQRATLWRVKGCLHTPTGSVWIDGTLAGLAMTPCEAPASLPAATSLAFVGPGLTAAVLRAELSALSTACPSGG